ncbi:elongation factor G [Candidatus Magnetominusculus xianensis]|uniref:Elongation factor G n=1 Tax=Candidatus Magnetominusculus xianensis TaxID=1748249 RepID=A0ABR5SCW1_9BACT|nr:elongation factor G [Candidatus Magnetominusculus xianensis]KWT82500.1 elongation factor G [Candidatus Magnetominusculus xianensis]MBF0405419.1 elongation factor G [Nitrospirota bacterium]
MDSVEKVRNVAILGHSGCGKTTLTEAILFNAGAITRMGSVTDGNSVTDFDPEEIERKVTINAAVATCEWSGYRLNLIDTPGFINFMEDTRGCLRIADGAVVVVSAIDGARAETQKLWKYADEFFVPRIVFVNEMDKENANFQQTIEQVEKIFSLDAVPLYIPMGEGLGFTGVVDVLNSRAYVIKGGKSEEQDIPSEMMDDYELYRKKLVEKVAELDDTLLEKYLETGELTQDEIVSGIRRGCCKRDFVTVACGSAEKNMAITQLLQSITLYLSSPVDRFNTLSVTAKNAKDGSEVKLPPEENAQLAMYVFKTIADPYAGRLTIFRVFSGTLRPDATLLNPTRGAKERVGQIFHLLGKKQIPVKALGPGEIGVVAKLKETLTGDTLTDEAHPVVFSTVKFAEPIISYAIEPKTKGDEEKVSTGLHRILDEDPTIKFHRDAETNEMIISGMGQVHIEVTLHKLKRKFGVDVEMKTPKIPYRETIRSTASVQGKYKKQSGGRGQFGDCWITVEPLEKGGGFEFVDKIVGGAIPRQYIPAVEKGVIDKMKGGIIAGYPLVDVRVSLYDGSYHAVDSSEMAFKIAGSMAIKKAVVAANPVLLEPIMKVEVIVPEDNLGAVIGDLNSRRGKVQGMESQTGGTQKIAAAVPMSEMLTYANQLHSITSGRGLYSMEFSHYEDVPHATAQKIIAMAKKEEEEE